MLLFTIAGLLRRCIHNLPASKAGWEVRSGHEALVPAVIVPDNNKNIISNIIISVNKPHGRFIVLG